MNHSQLVIYEKIKEMHSNKLNKIQDKVIDLELAIDHADLTDEQRSPIDEKFMELKLEIDDLENSF